uniref:Hairy n=1 Tax=Urechis unicinctus TaxID=6432 RepID=A0A517D2A8_UREUN|nr:hairy [Urechis unicinctus]
MTDVSSDSSLPPSSPPPRNQSRKTSKPLMEKRRRARINASLNQLKTLVLDSCKKDGARYSKLEKSDILELTVKHLQGLQSRHMSAAMVTDPTVASKFHSGYAECVHEVGRYLTSIDGLDPAMRSRLLLHLSTRTQQLDKQMANNLPTQPLFVHTSQSRPVAIALSSYPAVLSSGDSSSTSSIHTASPTEGDPASHVPFIQWCLPTMGSYYRGLAPTLPNPQSRTVRTTRDENVSVQDHSVSVNYNKEASSSWDFCPVKQETPGQSDLEQDLCSVTLVDDRACMKMSPNDTVWRPW